MEKSDFTEKAQRVMARAGEPECTKWPEGTLITSSSHRGGWGNFSYQSWWIPTPDKEEEGTIICWDSDDRDYSVARYNVKKQEVKVS